jgi:hypothetical protein
MSLRTNRNAAGVNHQTDIKTFLSKTRGFHTHLSPKSARPSPGRRLSVHNTHTSFSWPRAHVKLPVDTSLLIDSWIMTSFRHMYPACALGADWRHNIHYESAPTNDIYVLHLSSKSCAPISGQGPAQKVACTPGVWIPVCSRSRALCAHPQSAAKKKTVMHRYKPDVATHVQC